MSPIIFVLCGCSNISTTIGSLVAYCEQFISLHVKIKIMNVFYRLPCSRRKEAEPKSTNKTSKFVLPTLSQTLSCMIQNNKCCTLYTLKCFTFNKVHSLLYIIIGSVYCIIVCTTRRMSCSLAMVYKKKFPNQDCIIMCLTWE